MPPPPISTGQQQLPRAHSGLDLQWSSTRVILCDEQPHERERGQGSASTKLFQLRSPSVWLAGTPPHNATLKVPHRCHAVISTW